MVETVDSLCSCRTPTPDMMMSLNIVLDIGNRCLFSFDWNSHKKIIYYVINIDQIFSLLREIITVPMYNTERKEGALRRIFLKRNRELSITES